MKACKAFSLIFVLYTTLPGLRGQVPFNANPNQSVGLQKFFLVPESVLAQIPHQNKIIPIPQNVVSTGPATSTRPTFHPVQTSGHASLTPEQAEERKSQEAFRNQVIESNKKIIAQRQENSVASNQFMQNPSGQVSLSNQNLNNQQQDQQQFIQQQPSQVQAQQSLADGLRDGQPQAPARKLKIQRPKTAQTIVQNPASFDQRQNQVNQQQFQTQQQFQQTRVNQQQPQQLQAHTQQIHQQQFQQPQAQQQQSQLQQAQVKQQQVQQQQQFLSAQQPQFQPQQLPVQSQSSLAVHRHDQQDAAQTATSFLSTQPSTESQQQPVEFRSKVSDQEEINRHQAENAKYSFATAVTDGINDGQQIRQETRDGLKLSGLYSYSDGYFKRTIHYEADENGYRVTNEEIDPIGDGPNSDPAGVADVLSDVGGSSVRYSISGHDFPPHQHSGKVAGSSFPSV